jgi:hypothetical protein
MEDKEEEEQFSALPAFSACFEQEEIQTKPCAHALRSTVNSHEASATMQQPGS